LEAFSICHEQVRHARQSPATNDFLLTPLRSRAADKSVRFSPAQMEALKALADHDSSNADGRARNAESAQSKGRSLLLAPALLPPTCRLNYDFCAFFPSSVSFVTGVLLQKLVVGQPFDSF